MARWTKKLIAEQLEWTDSCFRKAMLDVFGQHMSEEEKGQDCNDMVRMIQLDWREDPRTPEANQIYLKYLCQLNTKQLELIVEAYQKGKQWRQATTIDVIMSELMERSIDPETTSNHE